MIAAEGSKRRRKGQYGRAFALLLSVCLFLAGCSQPEPVQTSVLPEDTVVYYLETDRLTLASRRFRSASENFDGLLGEMLDQFRHPAYSNVVSALPESVSINGYTMGVDNLTIDFNAAYLGLTNVQKVLLQAAVVKTLVQLPGVVSVTITVDGQLVKEADGTTLMGLTEDMFLSSQEDGLASDRFASMELYFATEEGDRIAKEERSVSYSSNMITEQAIAEEIIRGPESTSLRSVVNPDTRINSISIQGDICILDFSSAFNQPPWEGITPEACVYAFVNSICESGSVTGVRFEIDGEEDVRLWNQLSLAQEFTRDSEIIRRDEPSTDSPDKEEKE